MKIRLARDEEYPALPLRPAEGIVGDIIDAAGRIVLRCDPDGTLDAPSRRLVAERVVAFVNAFPNFVEPLPPALGAIVLRHINMPAAPAEIAALRCAVVDRLNGLAAAMDSLPAEVKERAGCRSAFALLNAALDEYGNGLSATQGD